MGTGAFTPNGELAAAGLESTIVTSWTTDELQLLAANRFSSSLRELRALLRSLQAIRERAPQLLQHRSAQYLTDSQVAATVLNRMGGNAELFPEVKAIWELCKGLDCELTAVWQPREHEQQRYADELSKLPDGSAWALQPAVFAQIEADLRQRGRRFTIDLFADETNCKVRDRTGAPQFFSRWWCPGTSGVDAFAQRWDRYFDPQGLAKRHMAFCNPPFECLGRVLRKLIDERVDAVLVYPAWPRYWRGMLSKLASKGVVKTDYALPHQADLFVAGARVPAARKGIGHKAPAYRVRCAIITWDKHQPGQQWRRA